MADQSQYELGANTLSIDDAARDGAALAELLDTNAVIDVIRRERFFRDRGRFDEQADCFAQESHVRLTWYTGSGRVFAEQSKVQTRRGSIGRHIVVPMWVQVRGDRALAESDVQIHIRGTLDGVEVDIVNDSRMVSRVIREDGEWKISGIDFVYFKDSVSPVFPADGFELNWDAIKLHRASYRILSYQLSAAGWDIDQELPGVDRPELVDKLYDANTAWLEELG